MAYIYGAHILDVSRSHTTTHDSPQDSSGRVISSSQRPLPDNTRHSQQTNIHAPGGIRTHDISSSVHRNNILVFNSNYSQMHKSQSLFNLIIVLHVSDVTITHLQEHKTNVTIASGNHYTVLLSAAILEKFQLFHDSSRQQYRVMVTRCCRCSCFVLLKMGDSDARNMQSNYQIK